MNRKICNYVIAGAVALLLTACGGSDRKTETREKERPRISRYETLVVRIDQMQQTLEQLEQENEIQRNRLAAAKGDLAVIRDTVIGRKGAAGERITTTIVVKQEPARADVTEDRRAAENRTLSTILLLCFLAIVILFIGKLWRDRSHPGEAAGYQPAQPPSPSAPPPSSGGSYTYPSTGPTESRPPAPAAESTEAPPTPGDSATDLPESQENSGPPAVD